jgi:hypothetical protein
MNDTSDKALRASKDCDIRTDAVIEAQKRWPDLRDPDQSRVRSAFMAGVNFILASGPPGTMRLPDDPQDLLVTTARDAGFSETQWKAMFYEQGPYDVTFPCFTTKKFIALLLERLQQPPHSETPVLPESLRDPAVVMESVRTLHQQTDTALWLLRHLNRVGGLGHDKHRLIDAVLEGRAYIRGDSLYTDGPPHLKTAQCVHDWSAIRGRVHECLIGCGATMDARTGEVTAPNGGPVGG